VELGYELLRNFELQTFKFFFEHRLTSSTLGYLGNILNLEQNTDGVVAAVTLMKRCLPICHISKLDKAKCANGSSI
jgi:hypothetical protein